VREVHDPSSHRILEGNGEPVCHDALIPTRGLDGNDVELEELDGVGRSIVVCADVRPKLVRPDHIALLTSEREAPEVVDELTSDLDVLARLTDVIDGAVVILPAALERNACLFWSGLDDLAAWLATR
jgi:hypothetical protein